MEFFIANLKNIILAISAVALLILVVKNYDQIKKFILEVRVELTKVHWSTRHELMGATVVVIVITSITAVYIGIIDVLLSKVLSILFK